MMFDRTCPICGTRFVTDIGQQKYCDAECKEKAYHAAQQRYRDRQKKKKGTLDDVVRAADAAGLSYGQYVARMRNAGNS